MVKKNKVPASLGGGEGASHRPACAACKYQRKKCTAGCVLRRHFPADERHIFNNVYVIFGLANVSKMIRGRESIQDQDQIARSLKWEAAMWESDPVSGPYGAVLRLQDEIRELNIRLREWERLAATPLACPVSNPNPKPNNSFHVNTPSPSPNGNGIRPDVNNHSLHVTTAIPDRNINGNCPMMRPNVNTFQGRQYRASGGGGAHLQTYPLPPRRSFETLDPRFMLQESHRRPTYMPLEVSVQHRTGPNGMGSDGWSEGYVNTNLVPSNVYNVTPTQYAVSERNKNTSDKTMTTWSNDN